MVPANGGLEALNSAGRGVRADRWFKGLAVTAGMLVLAVLAAIAISTTRKAWPALSDQGLSFITSSDFRPSEGRYGILALIYGTVVTSLVALVLAVPVSIGIALFTTEVAHRRLRSSITTVMDLLASVPSVVFGLVGFVILAPKLRDIYNTIAGWCEGIPVLRSLFGPSSAGLSFMTAGMVVALMITPIITSITREVLTTVPLNDKNGALALGATRWEMIRGVVFPHSFGGIVGAVMLGLGRAMGETIALALLIGANARIVANLFAAGEAMPSAIVRYLPEADGTFQAALIGVGVALFLITIVVNVSARRMVTVLNRRMKGAA